MQVSLDSNILIRLVVARDPLHEPVRAALRTVRANGHTFCAFFQNLAEFWNVCTRPATARGGFGLTVEEAANGLKLIERVMAILPDTPNVYPIWRQLVTDHSVMGVQVHDARLVAAMLAHGITHILTLNADDFRRYPGIVPVLPTDAATIQ